jgi:hypothetical protein
MNHISAQAEKMLRGAIKIWASRAKQGKREIPREVEAYNELGCNFRDWAIRLNEKNPRLVTQCLVKAEENLQKSIELAKAENDYA